jgi:hypothetical protein
MRIVLFMGKGSGWHAAEFLIIALVHVGVKAKISH